ncbi:MAG: hypothetical protein ACI3U1_10085 [Peptococcaceae bacterium]
MNLQEIQAIPLATSTEELLAPDARFAQPVTLNEAEVAEALQKADSKSANLLQNTSLPEEEALKQLVLELVALNREIELAEAKYRKAATEESYGLAARISTLQNHKTRLSTMFVANLCN